MLVGHVTLCDREVTRQPRLCREKVVVVGIDVMGAGVVADME